MMGALRNLADWRLVWTRRALLLLAAVLICAPVWLGVWHALAGGGTLTGPGATRVAMPGMPPPKLDSSAFPWWRFTASAISALAAGALSVLVGWPMARALGRATTTAAGGVTRGVLLGLSCTLLVVPPFVIARGVQALAVLLGWPTLFVPVFQVGGTADPLAGAFGVVLVGALNGWPIAGLLLGLGLRSRRASELDQLVLLPDVAGNRWRRRAAIWRIQLSRLLPCALIAGAIVALRTFLDDATPSLLGQRSFAREVQLACDTDGGVGPTALPFAVATLLVTLPLVALAIGVGMRTPLVDAAGRERGSGESAGIAAVAGSHALWLLVIAVSLGLPLASLALSPHAPIPWQRIAVQRFDALYGSVWLCGNTAVLGAAGGVALALLHRAEPSRLVRGAVWLALAVTLAWPPHPAAFGLMTIQPPANWSHAALRQFDLWRLPVGLAARYSLVAFLAARLALSRRDPSARDAALTSGLSPLQRFRVLHLWPVLRAASMAGLAVGLLALVERESAEVLFVPGFDTVTACVFRLLHTGTDSTVIGLLLITAGMVAALATAAALVLAWLRVR